MSHIRLCHIRHQCFKVLGSFRFPVCDTRQSPEMSYCSNVLLTGSFELILISSFILLFQLIIKE